MSIEVVAVDADDLAILNLARRLRTHPEAYERLLRYATRSVLAIEVVGPPDPWVIDCTVAAPLLRQDDGE